jgi:hypothetical protein
MPATKKSRRKEAATPDLTILKTATCPTLSSSSTLEYQFGKDLAGKLYLRISGSDGGGFYSKEWLEFGAIQKALSAAEPITSVMLRPLLAGQSVNTTGFLLAALLKEKLVERLPEKAKHYRLRDPAGLLDRVAKPSSAKPQSAKPAKKAPAKTSAAKPKAKSAAAK